MNQHLPDGQVPDHSKKFIIFVLVLVAAFFVWQYRFFVQKFFLKLPQLAQSPLIQEIRQDISAPPPLIGDLFERDTLLTVEGVVKYTNTNRAEVSNMPALKRNADLDQSAKLKLDDMFKQQYFEHESPQGKGPADLAKQAGYDYISIGENLALGNFDDDADLVEAWMNSPGHRANILSSKYTEIGVAVGKGEYKGKQVWLAVQEFGRPASSCPKVDANLKSHIYALRAELESMEAQLHSLKQELDESNPKTKAERDAYNKKVAEYNDLVRIYNNKKDTIELLTQQYNAQVQAYNSCVGE